jgi:hypothetical protein
MLTAKHVSMPEFMPPYPRVAVGSFQYRWNGMID